MGRKRRINECSGSKWVVGGIGGVGIWPETAGDMAPILHHGASLLPKSSQDSKQNPVAVAPDGILAGSWP